jgi:tRNA threonylcarbamoyladenosine biosynthesis protein TsaE
MKNSFITLSGKETEKIGFNLAKKIAAQRHSIILALNGELGSGKTIFTKGFLKGLGVKEKIVSPTFIIFRHYNVNLSYFKNIYHFDFYRIKSYRELKILGFDKILKEPKALIIIEWAQKIKKYLPKETIWINFQYGREINTRKITFDKK